MELAARPERAAEDPLEPQRPIPTGGRLLVLKTGVDAIEARIDFARSAGIRSIDARELDGSAVALSEALGGDAAIIIPTLGIAVVGPKDGDEARNLAMRLQSSGVVESARPEFYMFATTELVQAPMYADTSRRTWGVAAVQAEMSGLTGRGIKIAVLDTGFDLGHPDFAGRHIEARSFVPNEDVVDRQGHGTHCAGTIAGPGRSDRERPRYGVAPDVHLHVGKVLDNRGSGAESWILLGIEWAIASGCQVISMSLGRPTGPGEAPDPLYERAGRRAWNNDCLIVAAAGNESSRQFRYIAPVGAPANCKTIMAVAAIDQQLDVAEFSCGGVNSGGGEIDVAAPGVGVFSSFPMPQRYRKLAGTSMACPHVAGLAALWAESDSTLRGARLMDALKSTAMPLNLPSRDVGHGLATAPAPKVA